MNLYAIKGNLGGYMILGGSLAYITIGSCLFFRINNEKNNIIEQFTNQLFILKSKDINMLTEQDKKMLEHIKFCETKECIRPIADKFCKETIFNKKTYIFWPYYISFEL